MERLKQCQQPSTSADEYHTFGMFVAAELRSIKDKAYAKAGQRKLNKVLLQIMEDEPVNHLVFSSIYIFSNVLFLIAT